MVDLVLENAKALQRRLGRADQQRLDEYLTGIRSVEQRIDAVEAKRKLDLLDEQNPGPSKRLTISQTPPHVEGGMSLDARASALAR